MISDGNSLRYDQSVCTCNTSLKGISDKNILVVYTYYIFHIWINNDLFFYVSGMELINNPQLYVTVIYRRNTFLWYGPLFSLPCVSAFFSIVKRLFEDVVGECTIGYKHS